MKKFVQIRLQSKNNGSNASTTDHNLRMNETLNQLNHTHNILIYQNRVIKDNNLIKLEYKNIQNDRKKYIKEHNELYMKNNGNRHLKNCHSSISEGVITFSELIKEKMKEENFTEDLLKIGQNCIKEISEKLDTEILYISLHLDETTPHFHFTYKNYDNKGHSITHKNKNKEFLSNLQTLVGKHFEELGFERGNKKEFTNKNHQITKDFHNKEIDKLRNNSKILLETIKDLQKDRDNLKEEKKLIKEQKEREVSEKKLEYDRIDKKIKELNSQITKLKGENSEIEKQNNKLKENNTTLKNEKSKIEIERDSLQKTIGIQKINIENANTTINELKKVIDYKDYKKDSVMFFNKFFIREEKKLTNISKSLFNTINNKIEEEKEYKLGLNGTIDFEDFKEELEKYTQRQRIYSLDNEKQTQIENLNEIIIEKNREIREIKEKNSELNSTNEKNNGIIEKLTKEKTELTTDKIGLKEKVEKLEPLRKENKELTIENEKLRENNSNLGEDFTDLSSYHRENKYKIDKYEELTNENDKLKLRNGFLEKSNIVLKENIEKLNTTINKIVESFNSLKSVFTGKKENLTTEEIIKQHQIDTKNNHKHFKQ